MISKVQPLLNLMGRKTFPAGDLPESATAIKLANNMVLGCAMVAMGEGFSLIRKYGVATQMFYEVMTEGLFASVAYKGYGKTMVDQTYDNVGSPTPASPCLCRLRHASLHPVVAMWPRARWLR